MGEIEDHYRRKEAAAAAARPTFDQEYNSLVAVWVELRDVMLAGIRSRPPKRYEWITVDGERFACWNLWTDRDYTSFWYFLSDGRVVGTREKESNPIVFDIRPVAPGTTPDQARRSGRIWIGALHELCKHAMALRTNYAPGSDKHPRSDFWYQTVHAVWPQRYL